MSARTLTLVLLAIQSTALATEITFGKLPLGAISTNVANDVSAEMCREHLFDASSVQGHLPKGYRPLLAADYAKRDAGVAELLQKNPRFSTYAVGSLCFMSVGSFVVDGFKVTTTDPTPMAFWWMHATGPRDPRMQGEVEWVQLASWYSQDITQREKILATDPMAQFVDLEVTQAEPSLWRARLALANETIEAEVRISGNRKKRNAPEPGFMTVPFTGKGAGSFWVITYFGHHHQSAEGTWHAKGTGVFNDALRIPGEASVFNTFFQDGWSALSGLYGPEP